jgi:hypothetical protein
MTIKRTEVAPRRDETNNSPQNSRRKEESQETTCETKEKTREQYYIDFKKEV